MACRMTISILAAAMMGTVAGAAYAQDLTPAADITIEHPVWLKTPTGAELASHYPVKALSAGLSGGAVVECRVTPKGRLRSCTLISETPERYDFGKAVLKLAYIFQMAAVDKEGAPTSGRLVRLPLMYRLPGPGG